MAAQLVTKINRYIGTAAEIAAMTLTGIPTGSTFFESDTGILKVLNAAGALVTAPSESVKLSGSNSIVGVVDTVAVAGTAKALASHVCREVTIIALRTNTGYIYVGGSDVSSTVYGAELAAKDSITIAVNNTNLIYIDSSVNGEGISYVAI